MRVTDVATIVAPFSRGTWLDEIRLSTPMSAFPRHAEKRSTWRGPGSDLVWVLIRTENPDVWGIGQSRGGAVTEAIIRHHFADLLANQNALALNDRVAELRRAAQPYAEGGIAAMGVAAVELALWDLAARAAGLPLARLLGGSGDAAPYYLTVPHPDLLLDIDPDVVAAAKLIKVPARLGPTDGAAALAELISDLEAVRSRVPDELPIAVDCFMSWDVAFTQAFARAGAPLNIGWIEEPLHPLDFEGHRRLRDTIAPRVASGEHIFTAQDGRRLIAEGCVDVAQFDITWCGGLERGRALGRQAVDAGLLFAPHAAALQPWALHLVSAFGPGVWLEILVGVDGTATVPTIRDEPGVGIDPATIGFA